MAYESLNKEQLKRTLEEKTIVFNTLLKSHQADTEFHFSTVELRALMNARCRACLGGRHEEKDPDSPTGKILIPDGQPIAESAGGHEFACRSCKPVRQQLAKQGIRDVFI